MVKHLDTTFIKRKEKEWAPRIGAQTYEKNISTIKKNNNSQWKHESPINIGYFLFSHCCKHTTKRCFQSGN